MLVGANAARFAARTEEAIPAASTAAVVNMSGTAMRYDMVALQPGNMLTSEDVVLLIIARFRHFSEYYSAAAGVALLMKSSPASPLRWLIVLSCAAGKSNKALSGPAVRHKELHNGLRPVKGARCATDDRLGQILLAAGPGVPAVVDSIEDHFGPGHT
ncbi:hypothetical protein LAUMK4_01017 [Mycobacterium persicum]|uniref:Uncharacterized protein n=1 Tax=Mycobacterium persicum TaxID=1487726 RepID=A0ABY6RDY7_9MYCO|nr:hypothetical protein LAUMK4_01017 [Mycobacterium persicum]